MCGLRPAALALALCLSGAIAAQDGDELLLLDLCVNDACAGIAPVLLRDKAILIDADALQAAGIDIHGLATTSIGDRRFIDARAINHGSTVNVDRDALRVDLRIRPEQLPMQRLDLRSRRAADAVQLPLTAFTSYALSAGEAADRSAFLDAGIGKGALALRSTALWLPTSAWQRGLSRIEYDRSDHLQRWTLGDQFAVTPDALGGGALLGGIGIERSFAQDPFLITFPQPFVAGVLDAPGTVEVYSNGALISRRELQPGPFSLDNLGVPPGRADVQVIVRDNFGNQRELSGARFYTTSSLLAPGLSDFGLRVGLPRTQSFGGSYGDKPAVQAFYRRGLNRRLTLGGRVEGDAQLRNAGLNLIWQWPLGDLQLDLAQSDSDVIGGGRAHAAVYNFIGREVGFSLGQRLFTRDYRNLGQPIVPSAAPLRLDRFGSLSLATARDWSLLLTFGDQRFTGGLRSHTQGANLTWRVGQRSQIVFGMQHRSGTGGNNLTGIISFNLALDPSDYRWRPDSLGGAVAFAEQGNASLRLDARRSRPPGVGLGYDVSLVNDNTGERQGFARAEYQAPFARLAVETQQMTGNSSVRGLLSGGLVAIGGRAYATAPLDAGFALVRAPGLAGVRVERENLDVGRTDARGDLLVRDMLPHFPNKLGLKQDDIPLDYRFGRIEQKVAVPANAGAIVQFDVQPMHAARGYIFIDTADGSRPAAFGRLRVRTETGTLDSRLGSQGQFWFEQLTAGTWSAEVSTDNGNAHCELRVPLRAEHGIAELGEVHCRAGTETQP